MAGVNVPRNDRIESLLEEVQEFRRFRLDVAATDPMVPRGFKRRPRPKTAIIAQATAKAYARRESAEAMAAAHQQVARQRPCSNGLSKGAEAGSQRALRLGRCAHQIQRSLSDNS